MIYCSLQFVSFESIGLEFILCTYMSSYVSASLIFSVMVHGVLGNGDLLSDGVVLGNGGVVSFFIAASLWLAFLQWI